MENKEIIRQLKLTASLMELHDENPFKLKSYNTAAFNLEKFQTPLELLSKQELEEIEGVGKSMAAHIREIVDQGIYGKLKELLEVTPAGVIELLDLQGFGAKKIRSLWLDLKVEHEEELYAACIDGRVAELKGFGEKSQAALMTAIEFLRKNRGKLLYAEAAKAYETILEVVKGLYKHLEPCGEIRRKCEVVNQVELLIQSDDEQSVRKQLAAHPDLEQHETLGGPRTWKGIYIPTETRVIVRFTSAERFVSDLMLHTGTSSHLHQLGKDGQSLMDKLRKHPFKTEEEAYAWAGVPTIPEELREGLYEIKLANDKKIPDLITDQHLKGILHNHSTYSDGRHTLRDMATYCKELGYEYLGITDHSRSAFFARGMSDETVAEQHREVDELNKELKPFRIFKGIESDILFDGSLDYPDEILSSFDFVIASVHMIMNMDEKKATERILTAVSNPHTTILGHPTGRLLLEREGYPLNHREVIDACAEYGVAIEINANPHRLDLDWRWIQYALEKDVKLSINPDAHRKSGYHDMHYGVLAARKGGLTPEMNLNSLGVDQISRYFEARKERIKVSA